MGRALAHGAMDILTWGWWEVVATPAEGLRGKSFIVTVEYDKDNLVEKLITSDKD
jgi:hypothetical protein